jgi:hypothetical protein
MVSHQVAKESAKSVGRMNYHDKKAQEHYSAAVNHRSSAHDSITADIE